MDTRLKVGSALLLLVLLAVPARGDSAADDSNIAQTDRAQSDFFEEHIRPVLVERCYECHSADADILHGGLRVDTAGGMRKGGDSGPAVVPGDDEASLLIDALQHESFEMPPSGKLPEPVVANFVRWVRDGAFDPRNDEAAAEVSGAVRRDDGILNRIDYDDGREHWSIVPPQDHRPPTVERSDLVRTPVDAFILAKLESHDLSLSPEVDRATLLRRVKFDLVGLPPTPEELDAFLADEEPGAYERLVERLLASPHYGERWARHWLDVVRYSDSNGLDENYHFGHAWRYRDYVVRSFNEDKPYDEFLTEQLAGDLLAKQPEYASDRQRYSDAMIATGFLAIGPKMQAEPDNQKRVMDTIDELIDVTSQAFLGLSVACARCHNHKFDPISQRDYYALAGVFRSAAGNNGKRRDVPLVPDSEMAAYREAERVAREAREQDEALAKKIKELQQKVAERPDNLAEVTKQLDALMTERKPIREEKARLRSHLRTFAHVHTVHASKPEDVPVHIRGSHLNLAKEPVPRGALPLTDNSVSPPEIAADAPGRLELAQWLTDPQHPLTARVMVNRIWQGHFGRGLVDTPNDFGYRGSEPTHPELLDFLTREFVREGWSIKRLHRMILLSSTYRQASSPASQQRAAAVKVDIDNRLLWRQNRRRLEVEPLRDNLLAVAGLLDTKIGGRVFKFPNGERVTDDQSANKALASYESHRRAIYLPVIRVATYSMFGVFDLSDPSRPIASRGSSVVSPQALFMMNSDLVKEAAAGFAERLLTGDAQDAAAMIDDAYRLAYGRSPTKAERQLSLSYLGAGAHLPRETLWRDYCQSLMAASEFIYVD